MYVPSILEKSWQTKPIVGVRAFTQQKADSQGGCPPDYPEDIMYDIWPGTRGLCDCLERGGDRQVFLDQKCEKEAEGRQYSDDCKDVVGLAPIVQNIVNGVRLCGKLAERSLSETKRPISIKDSIDKR